MSTLRTALLNAALTIEEQKPWPRITVDADTWRQATLAIAAGNATLAGLWAEPGAVHMAVLDDEDGALMVLTLAAPDGRFPSVGLTHPPAQRLERAIADLHGLIPEGMPDDRRWLDHDRWGVRAPLGAADKVPADGAPYPFLKAEGPPLHQIAVGPVHAGIIEPGHFRFSANGEIVVRLEERLGYVHKGIEGLLADTTLEAAAKVVARVSGDSTVAYSLAFARAAEAALGVAVPQRAVWLRALMAELERLANHLGDIGAICNDAAFALMLAHCGMLREEVLRASKVAFGHRLMMDRIVPAGVASDLSDAAPIKALTARIRQRFPRLVELYDNTASLQNRTVATGHLTPELARRFGTGGPVGRASGRAFDARKAPGYPPYGDLDFKMATREDGDVDARIWVRIDEVYESLELIEQIVDRLPAGPIAYPLAPALRERRVPQAGGLAHEPRDSATEGLAMVEGFRGDVLVWLRTDETGRVLRGAVRDPSVFQWPLLEAAIEGNIVADFPLCNKSFNCSYSGHDL
ncbi:NADH-quinone oxidoreductase subunit C [Pleomorphomonas carboxyditropha]|uniref:Hydrogenase expression protein HypE n=1 Tax=Pleomorphomonas carboxyditropha TaxID=2023338 RepID=A0A2G9WQD8_9HYPH|nr:NADH-quinone oxidoreductase subunit C [Pleomorphomonas carboxyditropha]PIO96884.1 hydrogenase expression protein HypE [Pleomorphomonas carboxyditropha]